MVIKFALAKLLPASGVRLLVRAMLCSYDKDSPKWFKEPRVCFSALYLPEVSIPD